MPQMTVSITIEQIVRWGLHARRPRHDRPREPRPLRPGSRDPARRLRRGRPRRHRRPAGRLRRRPAPARLAARAARPGAARATSTSPRRPATCSWRSRSARRFVDRIQKRVEQDYRRLPYPITSDLFVVSRGTAWPEPAQRDAA